MIDLNHKSGKGQIVKLSTYINGLIDEALERDNAAQAKRDYIGMSELGDECLRRVYYNTMGATRNKLTGGKLRIFDAGHVFEEILAVKWLKKAGFHLLVKGADGKQIEVSTAGGIIKGHVDGVIIDGPPVGCEYPIGWETKALNNKWWKNTVKQGLQLSNSKYYGQVQLYMAYHSLHNFLFTAINKDTEEMYFEIIPFDAASAQVFSDRGVALINACRDGIPPPRMCPSASFFEAKWCQFVDHCFKDQ